MRVVIARFPFDLTKSGVLESMKGVKPEPVDGESVIIGRRHYPVKQVGQVITRQDRRDFTAAEVVRAMILLGFTCRGLPQDPAAQVHTGAHTGAATSGLTAFQRASAMLGEPEPVSVSA
ncbi:SCO5918 family protein [Streptomyces sp. NPDC085540]|uniref:SCO5918 family protein n=1 Tax=Streptomyces sp. NPDC085540 TaxID=3365730 RepID=UPI0037CEFE5E